MSTDNDDIKMPEIVPTTALEAQTRAEFDVAVATAHKFPRSIDRFRKNALSMATVDEEVAQSCYYRLSRSGREGDKAIEGPTVRFAEIVANCYGNLKFGARVIEIGDKDVVAQGVAHDLEQNVSTSVEVRRRITNREGRRYSDDMIAVTCNAACSIALRNAIFKAVPFALAKSIYEQAKKVAIGDATTLSERRTKMLEKFRALGVQPAAVFERLGVVGADDIGLQHIEELIGLFNAIKDGEAKADEEFNLKTAQSKPAKVRDTGEVIHQGKESVITVGTVEPTTIKELRALIDRLGEKHGKDEIAMLSKALCAEFQVPTISGLGQAQLPSYLARLDTVVGSWVSSKEKAAS